MRGGMIIILSGGTGTPKLLQGFSDRDDICVVVNVGEDGRQSGGYLSPDLDTVIYTLAGLIDEGKWYGVESDTFVTHERMARLGYRELLRIGDFDRGTKLARQAMLDSGLTLTQVTQKLCEVHGLHAHVFPASDDAIQTRIVTPKGVMSFHEFWVRDKGADEVLAVQYDGIQAARAPAEGIGFCQKSKGVLIGPSNPISSILPIVGVEDWKRQLKAMKVIAVSPFLSRRAFSGPAAALMRGCGFSPDPSGIARAYGEFARILVIHETDTEFKRDIRDCGMEVVSTNIILNTIEQKRELAAFLEEML